MSNSLAKKIFASALAASTALMGLVASAPVASAHGIDSVVKTSDGTIWFITTEGSNTVRRPFTSFGAFQSYGFMSLSNVVDADAQDLAYPAGSFIAPQDGKIFCATETKGSDVKGECSLVTGGQKAAFTSAAVFGGLGFSFSRALYGDSSFLSKTSNIDNTTSAHVVGVAVNNNGTVQLRVSNGLWGIPSIEVFNSYGYSFADVVPANAADKALTQVGVMTARQPGQLVPSVTTGGVNPPGGGGLGTGEGDIASITETSTTDSTTPEGDTSEVYGFQVEIDGDVKIDRIDIYVDTTAAGTESEDAVDYYSEAQLLVDGTKVASIDSEDWDEDAYASVDAVTGDTDEYRLRFANLNLNYADGDEPEFVLALKANSVIDSGDQTETWGADMKSDSIRFVDGRGFSDSDGDATIQETWTIEGEDVAELSVALSGDNPDGATIEVSDSDTTDGVEVFKFKISEENGVDATVNDLTLTATTLVSTDESAVLEDAHLYHGTTLLDSVPVLAGGVLAFEDLNLDIDADGEEELTLKVDVADVDGFTEGATLSVAFTSIDDADDANGNDESDMTISGTPSSETFEFRSEGISVTFDDAAAVRTFTADAAGEDDQGTFTIEFDVTAFGADAYIDASSEVGGADAAGQGVEFTATATAGTPVLGSDLLESDTTETEDNANVFFVEEDTTRHFTLTVIYSADSTPTDGSVKVSLESINWGTATDDTNANYYSFDLGDYKTPFLFLNGM